MDHDVYRRHRDLQLEQGAGGGKSRVVEVWSPKRERAKWNSEFTGRRGKEGGGF